MSGFVKMRVSKFRRAFVTRAIAIVPSIIIAFLGDNENFNDQLNILQSIQLPFAVIPLLKLSIDEGLMGRFTMKKLELFMLSILSAAIVGVNYYTSIPSDIDWSGILIYCIFTIMILYFLFLGLVLFTPIKPVSQVKESFVSEKSDSKKWIRQLLLPCMRT